MSEPVDLAGKKCTLVNDTRTTDGTVHKNTEQLIIKRVTKNLDREMYLVVFPDSTTTFVFPHEVLIQD